MRANISIIREEFLWALVFLPLPALIVFIAAVEGGQKLFPEA